MLKRLVKKYPLLLLIMIVAFVIRAVAGYIQSFSNDELSALYRLQFNNFHDLIYWGVRVDGHPALVQLFLYIYVPICGKSELLIRFPFILASTLSLGFVFFSLKKLSGEFTAYLVVIILAFAGFSVELGYFARPYALGILFVSASTYYWIRIFIEEAKEKKYWLFFILFAILSCYTHYFALLEIGILGVATFLFSSWKNWWKIMLFGGVVFVSYLPNINILAFQLSVGGVGGWLGKPKNYFLVDLVLTYFDRNPLIIASFVLFPMVVLIIQPSKPMLKRIGLFLFLSLVPFSLLYFYSIKINSLLQPSACFFFMPFLLAAFFSLFDSGKEIPAIGKWGLITSMVIFWGSVLIFNPAFAPIHFAEFKRIAKYIEQNESDSVTTVVAVNNPFYIDWYLKDKKPDLYITDMGDDLKFLRRFIDTCKTKEFIYAFTNQRSNGEIPFMIGDRYNNAQCQKLFPNSELYHFVHSNISHDLRNEPITDFIYYSGSGKWVEKGVDDEFGWKQMGVVFIEDSTMFSPTLEFKLKGRNLKPNNLICASVDPFEEDLCDLELVVSIENGNDIFWRSRKFSLQQGIRTNRTHFIVENFDHPEIDLSKSIVKVYLLNTEKCEAKPRWFHVSILKGNPYTTGYSQ